MIWINRILLFCSYVFLFCFQIAFGFAFDGESFGAVMNKLSGAGSAGDAISGFLNSFGVQPEVFILIFPYYNTVYPQKTTFISYTN